MCPCGCSSGSGSEGPPSGGGRHPLIRRRVVGVGTCPVSDHGADRRHAEGPECLSGTPRWAGHRPTIVVVTIQNILGAVVVIPWPILVLVLGVVMSSLRTGIIAILRNPSILWPAVPALTSLEGASSSGLPPVLAAVAVAGAEAGAAAAGGPTARAEAAAGAGMAAAGAQAAAAAGPAAKADTAAAAGKAAATETMAAAVGICAVAGTTEAAAGKSVAEGPTAAAAGTAATAGPAAAVAADAVGAAAAARSVVAGADIAV